MKFGVFQDDKPCSVIGFPNLIKERHHETHVFNSFEEASVHANNWLDSRWGNKKFILNVPIENDQGLSKFVIKEIENEEIVPYSDYKECDKCGWDHKYSPEMAREAHEKLSKEHTKNVSNAT